MKSIQYLLGDIFAQEMDVMADGNLLSKLVLSAIIVLFSLLFSCANVLGFLVRKLRRKANDYRML